jgi:hypothetical protein
MQSKIYLNGFCTSLVSRTGGVGYKVFLHLRQTVDSEAEYAGSAIEAYFWLWKLKAGLLNFITYSIVYVKRSAILSNFSREYGYFFDFYLPPDEPQNITIIESVYNLHETIVPIKSDGEVKRQNFHVRLERFDLCTDNDTVICLNMLDTNDDNMLSILQIREYAQFSVDHEVDRDRFEFMLPIYNCPLITLDSNYYKIHHFKFGVKLEELSIVLSKAEYVTKEESFDISVCQKTFDMIQRHGLHGGTLECVYNSYSLIIVIFISLSHYYLFFLL